MLCCWTSLPRLCRDTRGVTALEYALIGGIIVTTVVIGFTSLGNVLSAQFVTVSSSIR